MRLSVPATDCPRIRPQFLEEERGAMGQDWFEQEYMCRFVASGTEWIRREVAEESLLDGDPFPI
jgi:hypothetical protein